MIMRTGLLTFLLVRSKKLLLFPLLLLASCSFFEVKTPPTHSYVISRLPPYTIKSGRHSSTLMVMPMETSAIYNTTQMAYTTKPYQIAYFSSNEWAEVPTRMIQPLIVQTLQKTNYYRAVVTTPFVGQYQYILNTQLIELKQNFMHQPSTLELKINAQLVSVSSGTVMGSKEFYISQYMPMRTPYGGVLAANVASARILEQLARFVVQTNSRY